MNLLNRLIRPVVVAGNRTVGCTTCWKSMQQISVRNFRLDDRYQSPQQFPSPYPNDTIRMKLRRKLGMLAISKRDIIGSSANLYVACTDQLDIGVFFDEFELADTYFSWFVITELHLWMLMCRSMREGPEGQFLRNQLCNRLWEDASVRLKKLSRLKAGQRYEMMAELGDHFRAFTLCMDEGLLANDKTMASALWRNLYARECPHPKHLAKMIQYVRTQMDHLMSIDKEIILQDGEKFAWAHFEPFHVS